MAPKGLDFLKDIVEVPLHILGGLTGGDDDDDKQAAAQQAPLPGYGYPPPYGYPAPGYALPAAASQPAQPAAEAPAESAKRHRRHRRALNPRLLTTTLAVFSTMTPFSTLPSHEARAVDAAQGYGGAVQTLWTSPVAPIATPARGAPSAILVVPLGGSNKHAARDCDGPCSDGDDGITTSASVAPDSIGARAAASVSVLVVDLAGGQPSKRDLETPAMPSSTLAGPTTFTTLAKRKTPKDKPKDKPKGTDKKNGADSKTGAGGKNEANSKDPSAAVAKSSAQSASARPGSSKSHSAIQHSTTHHGGSTSHRSGHAATTESAPVSSSGDAPASSSTGSSKGDDSLDITDFGLNEDDDISGVPPSDDGSQQHSSKHRGSSAVSDDAPASPSKTPSSADGDEDTANPDESTPSEDEQGTESSSADAKMLRRNKPSGGATKASARGHETPRPDSSASKQGGSGAQKSANAKTSSSSKHAGQGGQKPSGSAVPKAGPTGSSGAGGQGKGAKPEQSGKACPKPNMKIKEVK